MSQLIVIKNKREFNRVYQKGKQANGRNLSIFYQKTRRSYFRYGVAVSRQVRGAVGRNRLKRLLREVLRLHRAEIKGGYDLIVLGRGDWRSSSYAAYEQAFLQLAQRLELLQTVE